MPNKKYRIVRKSYSETIGDGLTGTFAINHGLGSEDVLVQVRAVSGLSGSVDGAAQLLSDCEVQVAGPNKVLVGFAQPPASMSRRVVVV